MTLPTLKIATGLLIASALLPSAARADQFQWIEPGQAERAQATIAAVGIVRHHCAPCGDAVSRAERVDRVEIAPVPDGDGYWNVLVNGEAVDLAYVYVPQDGAWRNLALLLDLDASGVSPRLDRQQLHAGK